MQPRQAKEKPIIRNANQKNYTPPPENDKKPQVVKSGDLHVVLYPNPILKEQAVDVQEETIESIRKIVPSMFKLLYKTLGVGLAAPQVGHSLRFFIMNSQASRDKELKKQDPTYSSEDEKVFINPEIIESEGEQDSSEGCLSVPSFITNVDRKERVVVKARNLDFEEFTEEFTGFEAAIIQHELDHLNGTLLVDHASESDLALQKGLLGSLEKHYQVQLFLAGKGKNPLIKQKRRKKQFAPKKRKKFKSH